MNTNKYTKIKNYFNFQFENYIKMKDSNTFSFNNRNNITRMIPNKTVNNKLYAAELKSYINKELYFLIFKSISLNNKQSKYCYYYILITFKLIICFSICYNSEPIIHFFKKNKICFCDFIKKIQNYLNIKHKNEIGNFSNKLKVQRITNKKYNIKERNFSSYIYIVNTIMKIIIILNLFTQTKNNIIKSVLSKYSQITLKVSGKGKIAILSNQTNYNFTGMNYLDKVIINGEIQQI